MSSDPRSLKSNERTKPCYERPLGGSRGGISLDLQTAADNPVDVPWLPQQGRTDRGATLRDILRVHLKQWEVIARTRELNEYSSRAEPTWKTDEGPSE